MRARLYLIALCLGWGVTWPTMRIALSDIPPFSMRVGTLVCGCLMLVMLARLQGRSLAIADRRAWRHVLVAGLLNIVGFSVCTPFAQLSAATSRVAIVVYTMPIWAALLARPVLGERITPMRALALALCALGMAVLIWPLLSLGTPVGILFALGAAMSWAAGTVYVKWSGLAGDPLAFTVWQLIVGVTVVSICVPLFEGSLHIFDAHGTALAAMIFSGIVGSGICYVLWFDVVRRVPAMVASLAVLSVPAVGVIASAALLGERPTVADIAGFAMIFAASACVLLGPQSRVR